MVLTFGLCCLGLKWKWWMPKIRVQLADDHAILRAGLSLLIATQSDMEVIAETEDHESTLRTARELRPDVISLDISMPKGSCVDVIKTISHQLPETRVLVLTMHDDEAYFRMVMAAGAFGYVVKKAADVELLDAIRCVSRGQVYTRITPSNAHQPVAASSSVAASTRRGIETLSKRELEVLCLVALGHTNQAVSEQLSLSVKTIESYRARLMTKLGLQNRVQLTQFAIDIGLLQAEKPPHLPNDKH